MEFKKEKIARMFVMHIIECTHTRWTSPVVFVPESDNALRFSIDYRESNAVTTQDSRKHLAHKIYRLATERYDILDIGRGHRILASRNCRKRSGQNIFPVLPRTFGLQTNVFWIAKRLMAVSRSDGCPT